MGIFEHPRLSKLRVVPAAAIAVAALVLLAIAPAHAAPAHAAPAPPHATTGPAHAGALSGHAVPGTTGRAAAHQLTQAQLADRRSTHHAAVRPAAPPVAQLTDDHKFWAVYPTGASAPTGAFATHSVSPALRTSHAGDVIYAPTLYPAGNSCIENTTAYFHDKAEIWAWDWCNGQTVGKYTLMDSSFQSTYVRSGGYQVWIAKTDATENTWQMRLYNYTTSQWDTYYTSSGYDPNNNTTGTDVNGWDAFEVYSATDPSTGRPYICADTAGHSFTATGMQQQEGGSWKLLSSSDSTVSASGAIFDCANLRASFTSSDYAWRVSNP
ncbi:hypothetical protein [Streptomyces sp. NBC_01180]|uniref:hypothetical protein n=1 Tax=Streptomyces sp. NBC_01180 TaxID=2903763 RepID=UPI00386DF804|nr:hypothetical protein OG708_00925 [Streptomyces sp. NBC_01180]